MQTRQLAIRTGSQTGETMIQPRLRWRPTQRGRRPQSGQRSYHETLLGQTYRISGAAFFQVNSQQAKQLLELVVERVQAVSPRVVVDAYGGVGTIAAQLAPLVDTVVTIEESAAAGNDADVNLAEFKNVPTRGREGRGCLPGLEPSPDVVVIDPPRAGIDAVVVQAIIDSVARRVVYVSAIPVPSRATCAASRMADSPSARCSPSTCSRTRSTSSASRRSTASAQRAPDARSDRAASRPRLRLTSTQRTPRGARCGLRGDPGGHRRDDQRARPAAGGRGPRAPQGTSGRRAASRTPSCSASTRW